MSAREVKVHWIKDGNVGPTRITTGCGKDGWKETVADEYTTGSYIFEAVMRRSLVTCKTCIRVYDNRPALSSTPRGGEA